MTNTWAVYNFEIVASFLAKVIQQSIMCMVIHDYNLQGWEYFLTLDNRKNILGKRNWIIFTFYWPVSNIIVSAFLMQSYFYSMWEKCIEKWWICDHVFFSFTIKALRGYVFIWASCQPIRVYCWRRSWESSSRSFKT